MTNRTSPASWGLSQVADELNVKQSLVRRGTLLPFPEEVVGSSPVRIAHGKVAVIKKRQPNEPE